MIGTPFEPRFDGRILFLEDTGEKAYRIDRMLVQLRQSGRARARLPELFSARFARSTATSRRAAMIARFVAEQTAGLGCPVLWGIEAGHGTENFTIPFGVRRGRLGAQSILAGAPESLFTRDPARYCR